MQEIIKLPFFTYRYWLFESKGRIATTIGSVNITPMPNLSEAIAAFKSLYFEKTGNEFGADVFVKKPGKYNQMPVDHATLNGQALKHGKKTEYSTSTSTLSEPMYNLIDLIFDVNVMESTWISFDLDLNKMPLGKINGQQIRNAMDVLREIETLLRKKNGTSSNHLVDATNKFYSLIPHNFGVGRPPLMNTKEMINKKYEMLSDMQQMDITYNILIEKIEVEMNPVDIYYRKLNSMVDITDLDKDCDEYKEISSYVKNTTLRNQANRSGIELLHVFKILRHEEIERFARFEGTANRKLLFHGTRLTNIVGIMTNGLKLPQRGCMFRKGIFFSDSVSKSANFCGPSILNDDTFMLLCEVALGRCEDARAISSSGSDDRPNIDSLQRLGSYNPRTNHVRPDGLIVPNGRLELRDPTNSLRSFNEYIVYDESRVKIKYLIKIKIDESPLDQIIPNPLNLANPANLLNPINLPNLVIAAIRNRPFNQLNLPDPPNAANLPNLPPG